MVAVSKGGIARVLVGTLLLFLVSLAQLAQAKTFLAGAYIIDMGVEPQTEGNGLKPYGLVYDLVLNGFIPVNWIIRPGKLKDGVTDEADFTYKGPEGTIEFKGGPFIIEQHFAEDAAPILANWQAKGVVVHGPMQASFAAPVAERITSFPNAVLDQANGQIGLDAFYTPAEIPASSYRLGLPSDLNTCDDLYLLTHADPQDWDDADKAAFTAFISDIGGYLFAGCHAVSGIEALVDFSGDGIPDANYLSTTGLIEWTQHGDNEPDDADPDDFDYRDDTGDYPVMQFMGRIDNALRGGSEDVYLPKLGGSWRPQTTVAVWDPDQKDVVDGNSPGEAAVLVYGRAFGDPNQGLVVYQSSHTWLGGNEAENVAAGRTIGNTLLKTGADKAPQFSNVDINNIYTTGETNTMSADVTGIEDEFDFQWTDNCGGTFNPATGSVTAVAPGTPAHITTEYTAAFVTEPTACIIRLVVEDNPCIRSNFIAEPIIVVPASGLELDKAADPLTACPGDPIDYTLTPSYDGIPPLTNLCLSDSIPPGSVYVPNSALPVQDSGPDPLEWCLGSNSPGVPGIVQGGAECPYSVELSVFEDTWINAKDPGRNFGVDDRLHTASKSGEEQVALLRFTANAVPAGAMVQSAQLQVTVDKEGADRTVLVQRVLTPWTEGSENNKDCVTGASWNAPNCTDTWADGGVFSTADLDGVPLDTLDPTNKGTLTADVTAAVQAWVDGNANAGLALVPVGSNDGAVEWFSKENGADMARLVVNYTAPTEGGCSGPTIITDVEDTYIDHREDGRNFGVSPTLDLRNKAGEEQASLIRFNLLQIPAEATITSADLSLTMKSGDPGLIVGLVPMVTEWTEGTQDNQACTSGASWLAPNCSDAWSGGPQIGLGDLDLSRTIGGFAGDPKDTPIYTVLDPALVSDWVTGNFDNNGIIAFVFAGQDLEYAMYSSDSTDNVTYLPTLTVDWSLEPTAGSSVAIAQSPLMITGSGTVTVTVTVRADNLAGSTTINAPVLTPSAPAGAVVNLASGPTPATYNFATRGGVAIFEYTYDVTVGSEAGELTFSGVPTIQPGGDPELSFVSGTSNSTILAPVFSFQVQVDPTMTVNDAQSIINQGNLQDDVSFQPPNNQLSNAVTTEVPVSCFPTAISISRFGLEVSTVSAFTDALGVARMSDSGLQTLLQTWDPEAASGLPNASRQQLLNAIHAYLDPDGDGDVALVKWDTLEERGTIGFYVKRREVGGDWQQVNERLLPGLIVSPMGGEYVLADPAAASGVEYDYMLVEQEAWGTTRRYGPFRLVLP